MVSRADAAPRRPHRGVAVFLIAALGIGLTAGVLVLNQQRAQRIADTQAVSAVERAAGSLTLSFERTEEIVTGLAGFVMSSEQVDRDEFDRYVDRFLAGHPEFRSVQLLDYVTEAERTAFEAKLSGVGITGITERHAGDAAVTAPDRDDYLVVWFDAPTFGPDGSAGTNILTTPELDETLDEMVESGDTGVPPSVALPGPGRGEFGVPVLQPIFDPDLEPTTADEREGALVGAASVVISYSELIADDLAAVSDKVDLALADPEVNGQEFLLATRDGETLEGTGAASGAPPVPEPTDTAVVQLGPRELLLSASPRQSAVDAIAAGPRGWIIMIGLVLTLAAVAAYVRWSRVRRLERFARALEEANERLAMSTAELQEVVGRDRLTGLPNRQSVHQMVEDAMASDPDRGVSVVIIDLDRFKELNDSMGHRRGDDLLRLVAERLDASVRSGTLGRMGGDEFCAMLTDVDAHTAGAVAERLVSSLRKPFRVGDRSVSLTATAAVCSSPADASSSQQLLEHAGMALHLAKATRRDTWMAYDDAMARQHDRRRTIENELRYALEGHGTPVLTHFQPKVDLETGRIVSAEALARWKHPELGEVAPTEFIDVAEESGLIVGIGEEQIGRTIELLRRCRSAGLELESISVNVSAQQFQNERLVEHLRRSLQAAEVPAGCLVLEITESEAMDRSDDGPLHQRMEALREMGVGLSIDDFGTGYSSMSRVEHLPVHEVKVDQSFVAGLPEREVAVGITRAIVSMAHTLKMRVVAEGVETELQRDWLRDEGCDQAQGWLYARAMDADSFMALLIGQESAESDGSEVDPRSSSLSGT